MVLAGGAGNRLGDLTKDTPKAMIKVGARPLLEWIIEWLAGNGVENVVIGVAYLKDKIMNYFGDGSDHSVNVTYSVHTVEGGTAQGFRRAIDRYVSEKIFFALNGDQITHLGLQDLATYHLMRNPVATLVSVQPHCPFGFVDVGPGNYANRFIEKPQCQFFCNAGIYVFDRSILDYLPDQGDIEKTTFTSLVREEKLLIYPYSGFFVTINTYKDLVQAESLLEEIYT